MSLIISISQYNLSLFNNAAYVVCLHIPYDTTRWQSTIQCTYNTHARVYMCKMFYRSWSDRHHPHNSSYVDVNPVIVDMAVLNKISVVSKIVCTLSPRKDAFVASLFSFSLCLAWHVLWIVISVHVNNLRVRVENNLVGMHIYIVWWPTWGEVCLLFDLRNIQYVPHDKYCSVALLMRRRMVNLLLQNMSHWTCFTLHEMARIEFARHPSTRNWLDSYRRLYAHPFPWPVKLSLSSSLSVDPKIVCLSESDWLWWALNISIAWIGC